MSALHRVGKSQESFARQLNLTASSPALCVVGKDVSQSAERGDVGYGANPGVIPVLSQRIFRAAALWSSVNIKTLGEIGITGVGAAIANAVFNATGKRVRDLPITLDKVM